MELHPLMIGMPRGQRLRVKDCWSNVGRSVLISIKSVYRSFGDIEALRGIDLKVNEGEFISILGPSGCGKTTLLRIIGGFEFADSGDVFVGGANLNGVPPHKRPVNTVFQRYALFPHKTVEENIAYALQISRVKKSVVEERVKEMLCLVRLEGFEKRSPKSLSGGQAQRVALARALINQPKVLLLDEPLAALDLKLRQTMHFELRRIQSVVGSTFVYVTHDQEEALTMSDRIVLMNRGRIEQIGSPTEVYRQPKTRFVSEFIGEVNLFSGKVSNISSLTNDRVIVNVQTGSGLIAVCSSRTIEIGSTVWISVRPEHLKIYSLKDEQVSMKNSLSGTLVSTVFLGAFIRHQVSLADGQILLVQVLAQSELPLPTAGSLVAVEWGEDNGILLCE